MNFFTKILLFSFLIFNLLICKSRADFFNVCRINQKNVEQIKYVLQNGNSKFIPIEIDEIQNETFQQALYLLLFYNDTSLFPEEMIDIIGLDTIKQISSFKKYTINYILKKNQSNELKLKKELKSLHLNNDEILIVLESKYFQPENISKNYIQFLIKKVFMETMLKSSDIQFLIKKYKNYITDTMLFQQIRLKFWNNNIDDINKIQNYIKTIKLKNKTATLQNFYKKINKKNEYFIKLKNGKTKKQIKSLSNAQKLKICKPLIGYDEYIDLYCLKFINDNEFIYDILKNNLNPVFLPSQWLKYSVAFVRDEINKNKEIDNDIYEIIANQGDLYKEDYYVQQFLSGLTAYIRGDYENAILHFDKCAKNSKFAESNAKANYWLGMTYAKNGNQELSLNAFIRAKTHIFTMYGQLASSELGEDPKQNIEDYILSFKEEPKSLCKDVNFVIGYLQQYKNINNKLSPILHLYISDEKTKEQLFNALNVIQNDFKQQYAAALSVYSIKYDVINQYTSFPITDHTDDSLVHAIIKQESNFKTKAISNKGAAGIMQIMPSTGKILAKNMGIKYNYKQLLHDEEYNIGIGQFYLENLLQQFDNNKILALAAYNAGSGNVKKWIERYNDPRKMTNNYDIVEWIEKIPFSQTREYITKILGFEMVYDVIKKINQK